METNIKHSNLQPSTAPDLMALYRHMLRSRLFEKAVRDLWDQGKISGEMHMGMGEEAIAAGVVCQLQSGDAMALDHRGTPPLIMRGVDPVLLLREFLGRPDGLCKGMGGHMHLFVPQALAASSGIVGASGPAGAGFALAAQYLRPGKLAVAFFGEGALNQGMMMESLNLSVAWNLPVIFVCKDNGWAITTSSPQVTGGNLAQRVEGFGMPVVDVDGSDVEAVWLSARTAMQRARDGGGPTFLLARCTHIEGHFLGDPLLRIGRSPWQELPSIAGALLRSTARIKGAGLRDRIQSVRSILDMILGSNRDSLERKFDPILTARQKLQEQVELRELENDVRQEVEALVATALGTP